MTENRCIEPDPAPLRMWVIYDHPRDLPDMFVARLWVATNAGAHPTGETISEAELDTIRKYLCLAGLVCVPRQEGDDPVIVEIWL